MRIIFVRHGDPDYANDRLTDTGLKQAAATAVRLQDEGITEIYASPMGRAMQTAAFTAEKLQLPITKLDFMHEISWKNEGSDDPLIRKGHPWTLGPRMICEQEDLVRWREHPYFSQNLCNTYLDLISSSIDQWLAGLGFSREGQCYRCTRPNETTVALFAHGGSGACAISHMFNLPFPYLCAAFPYDFCSVSVFDFPSEPGELVFPRLTLFNDTKHTQIDTNARPVFGN